MTPNIQQNLELAAELLRQWNASHGPAYELRLTDLEWNLTKQSLVEYQFAILSNTPVLLATASSAGINSGLPAKNIWLCAWGKIQDEAEFINELNLEKSSKRKSKIVIGGDEFHLTPGVPLTPAGEKLKTALEGFGFKGAEAADYFGSLSSTAVSAYIDEAQQQLAERGLSFKEVTTPTDISTAQKFLSTEFPGRWTREFQFWSWSEDTQRAFWKLLRTQDGEVIGFARMAVRGRVTPLTSGWTPGALRMPTQLLSPSKILPTDCCLGPIGVASSQRGKGTGKVLLGLVLESLRNSPGEQICIDWTNAFKYYEPLKFEIARRYWTPWMVDPE